MLRLKVCFLTVALVLVTSLVSFTPRVSSNSNVVRLTTTSEPSLNLNPSLSDDGRAVVFESLANFFSAAPSDSFHAIRVNVGSDPPVFADVGKTRIVSPALSKDASVIAFASTEDLIGENVDRNSEIYLRTGPGLRQITHTLPDSDLTRLQDGNLWPSITADGRLVAFTSRGHPSLLDVTTRTLSLLSEDVVSNLKLSGDGSKVYYQTGDDLVSLEVTSGSKRIIATNVPKLAVANGRAVSNDSARLVFSAEPVANQSQVFLYDARENAVRQLTQLGSRSTDVPLNPTISGDGKRVAFATRRKVTNTSDGSVELYLYDIPSGQVQQITNAPASATAEVVASLNFDGSLVAFSFPRVLSGPATDEFANNSEIYLASLPPRSDSGVGTVFNAAALGNEPTQPARIAPGSIATIRGSALTGATVKVNGLAARTLFITPEEVVFVAPDELADGPAEFLATNADGFVTKAEAVIARAAPGIFAVSGAGEGEAIVLDSDTLVTAPFDPTNGHLRLSIFATGLAHAQNVSATINGQPVKVESVTPNAFSGLDEIHVLVPAELRGAGKTTLTVTADALQANATTVTLGGSSLRDIVINELLADPPDGLNGDANHDGVRDTSADEFVELVNSTAQNIDLGGYQLQSRSLTATNDTLRHRFAQGTTLFAGTAIVVFGGGSPNASNSVFGGSQIVKASSGALSLVNGGGVVTLRNPTGEIVTSVAYGSAFGLRGDQNQSLTRSPDITGALTLHSTAPGSNKTLFSPGTRLDGSAFIRNLSTASIASPANICHALSLRSDHFPARALRFRQLPRRPT
ncbi:MAG TPA: lamin tail domain-containing protein [Pyrinomonadaceae bacterium]|nr:lamin tail domain-containing protein [Pyrinomonadaceae bacterium]